MNTGLKFDKEKQRWDLLPYDVIGEIVKVITFGARKYADNNWKITISEPGGSDRYFAALMRHIVAWRNGEKIDPESGIHHLAHAGCCIIFLLFEDIRPKKSEISDVVIVNPPV